MIEGMMITRKENNVEATEKAKGIDQFLTMLNGIDRKQAVRGSICTFCHKPATGFRNEISEREYRISGLCQECQDETFGID